MCPDNSERLRVSLARAFKAYIEGPQMAGRCKLWFCIFGYDKVRILEYPLQAVQAIYIYFLPAEIG